MSVAMPATPHQDPYRPPPPGDGRGPVLTMTPEGRIRHEGLSSSDRTYATWIHLSPAIAFWFSGPFAVFAPLIMWLARREMSPFIDDHGREVVNFAITGAIVAVLAVIPILGWLLGAIWFITGLVNVIRGAVAASRGEFFRYPLTIRFISP